MLRVSSFILIATFDVEWSTFYLVSARNGIICVRDKSKTQGSSLPMP